MTPPPAQDKASVRLRGRTARCSVPDDARTALSSAASERLLALPELASARTVLAYAASAEEIDPAPAIAALRERGAIIAYPRVSEPGRLTLHRLDNDTALECGAYGIGEPPQDAPTIEPDEIDVVIVPGVAFDRECCRIGHGGGYYDRLLCLLGGAAKIGLAFDGQVFDEVPTDVHDVTLDAVVTPTRTIRART